MINSSLIYKTINSMLDYIELVFSDAYGRIYFLFIVLMSCISFLLFVVFILNGEDNFNRIAFNTIYEIATFGDNSIGTCLSVNEKCFLLIGEGKTEIKIPEKPLHFSWYSNKYTIKISDIVLRQLTFLKFSTIPILINMLMIHLCLVRSFGYMRKDLGGLSVASSVGLPAVVPLISVVLIHHTISEQVIHFWLDQYTESRELGINGVQEKLQYFSFSELIFRYVAIQFVIITLSSVSYLISIKYLYFSKSIGLWDDR